MAKNKKIAQGIDMLGNPIENCPTVNTKVSINPQTLTKAQQAQAKKNIELDKVDNTSDAEKQVYEANLQWGGKNLAGSYSPLDGAMISELGANRFAYLKPEGVKVEYSRDGGETWADYGLTVNEKRAFFGYAGLPLFIGKDQSVGVNKSSYQLRVTVTSDLASIYTKLNKFAIFISTEGSNNCWCTIDKITKADVDAGGTNWQNVVNKTPIAGWSGYNIINIPEVWLYSNSSQQFQKLRFTFGGRHETESEMRYGGLQVISIKAFGGVGWKTPSTLANWGHAYAMDELQNCIFPAQVKGIGLDAASQKITNVATPTISTDAANKAYVDRKTTSIAKTSLATDIQTSLNKADNAIQQSGLASYITARGDNLITNGNGFMGNNYNFTDAFTFDPIEVPDNTPGSFRSEKVSYAHQLTEFTLIDLNSNYEVSMDMKINEPEKKRYQYLCLFCFDIDGHRIMYYHSHYLIGSTTELAQDLNPGDTVVHLTSSAGFGASTDPVVRGFIFWNYKNSYGYEYPAETYSRNVHTGLWSQGDTSFKDDATNTITLDKAWEGPKIVKGTKLSQSLSGVTYIYPLGAMLPNDDAWHTYKGILSKSRFWAGAAKIKFGFLANNGGTAGNKAWIANLNLYKANVTKKEESTVLRAVELYDTNTTEDKAKNVANIKTYVNNLNSIGVNTTEASKNGYTIPFRVAALNMVGYLYCTASGNYGIIGVGKEQIIYSGYVEKNTGEFVITYNTLGETTQYATLQTSSKLVLGAINEVNTLIKSKASTSVATISANGLMSAVDKKKLDGIAEGANKTVVENDLTIGSTNAIANGVVADKFMQVETEISGLPTSNYVDTAIASVNEKIDDKQDKLVSGTNIKTINGSSILGNGNITISGSGGLSPVEVTNGDIDNATADIEIDSGSILKFGNKLYHPHYDINTIKALKQSTIWPYSAANSAMVASCGETLNDNGDFIGMFINKIHWSIGSSGPAIDGMDMLVVWKHTYNDAAVNLYIIERVNY